MTEEKAIKETGCCPIFNPEPWDKKEFNWDNKLFVKDRISSFLRIPLNFGSVMKRVMEKIEKAGAKPVDFFLMTDENSLWGADLYVAVDKNVPDASMSQISGKFFTKVYEGPYKEMGQWMKDMTEYVKSQDKELKKMYYYYTTCPKCAKVYGKNYVVILAKV